MESLKKLESIQLGSTNENVGPIEKVLKEKVK